MMAQIESRSSEIKYFSKNVFFLEIARKIPALRYLERGKIRMQMPP
jgi:hypothetical protein